MSLGEGIFLAIFAILMVLLGKEIRWVIALILVAVLLSLFYLMFTAEKGSDIAIAIVIAVYSGFMFWVLGKMFGDDSDWDQFW